jgi:hypothetical protein
MYEHEHYETLCAAAVAGQITEPEWSVLCAHLAGCPSCTEALASFGRLSTDLIFEEASQPAEQQIAQLRRRFLERAAAEGFPAPRRLSVLALHGHGRWSWWGAVAATAALLVFAALGFRTHYKSTDHTDQATGPTTGKPSSLSTAQTPPAPVPTPNRPPTLSAGSDEEKESLREELERGTARTKTLEEEKAQLLAKSAEQRRELEARTALIASLREERNNDASRLADALNSLEKVKDEKDASEVEMAAQQNEIRDLNERLRLQVAQLDRDKALFGKNGQSILAARNLHIIDVYDADGNGKRKRSFGRLFYEEGKRLVFYAYDLSDANHPAPHFYAWGTDKGDPHFIARLGILHNDGNGEGRWELTFENGGVLSKIDSVFVTAESKEVAKPKGRRVLFAVLGGVPNHP